MTTETSAAVCPGLFHVLIDGRRMPTEGEAWAELERRNAAWWEAHPDKRREIRGQYRRRFSSECSHSRHRECMGMLRSSPSRRCDCFCHGRR